MEGEKEEIVRRVRALNIEDMQEDGEKGEIVRRIGELTIEDMEEEWEEDLEEEVSRSIDALDTEEEIAKYIDAVDKQEEIARSIAISKSIDTIKSIENEISSIYKFLVDIYRFKFPDLESFIRNPVVCGRLVKGIATGTDIAKLLSGHATVASTDPIPAEVLQSAMDASNRFLALDSEKKKVLDFLQSRVGYVAPNLCAIVGSDVAAKLMATAGGLSFLANLPEEHINDVVGHLESTEVFQRAPSPSPMRTDALRLLVEKSKIAAQIDSTRADRSGSTGRAFREEICQEIEKLRYLHYLKEPVTSSGATREDFIISCGLYTIYPLGSKGFRWPN